jgi:hypothetical protein
LRADSYSEFHRRFANGAMLFSGAAHIEAVLGTASEADTALQ